MPLSIFLSFKCTSLFSFYPFRCRHLKTLGYSGGLHSRFGDCSSSVPPTEDNTATLTISSAEEVIVQPPLKQLKTDTLTAGPSGTATPATLVTISTKLVVQAPEPQLVFPLLTDILNFCGILEEQHPSKYKHTGK